MCGFSEGKGLNPDSSRKGEACSTLLKKCHLEYLEKYTSKANNSEIVFVTVWVYVFNDSVMAVSNVFQNDQQKVCNYSEMLFYRSSLNISRITQ